MLPGQAGWGPHTVCWGRGGMAQKPPLLHALPCCHPFRMLLKLVLHFL